MVGFDSVLDDQLGTYIYSTSRLGETLISGSVPGSQVDLVLLAPLQMRHLLSVHTSTPTHMAFSSSLRRSAPLPRASKP